MARRILHVIWIGLLWYSCTWETLLAARPAISTGSADRRSPNKHGRPILAMANSPRCIYNGKPVEDGRQVSSPEPCLNCTCNKGVLLCYLHSCMPTVVPSPECYVARVKGRCCPEVFCKVSTAPPSPSTSVFFESPIRRSDDPLPSKKRPTPADEESIGLLPVLLKRNHNKASSAAQMTETPVLETSSIKSTPPFFQSNHRPGGTIRDRPHFKRRSTTVVSTRTSPNPAISRFTPPPRVSATREPPEEEERDKVVYDLRLGASPNSTKTHVSSHSSNDTASCYVNGYSYQEGMAMLSSSKCEYCYCIRGHQMCVRPKCHLKIDGCEARYHSGFTCCPSHYYCEPEVNKSSADLTENLSSNMKPPRPTATALHKGNGCIVDGHIFSLGVAVPSRGHCQTCYCTQVGVVCRRLECAPRVDGCEPVVPEGHCCPREYTCGVRSSNSSEGLVSHSTDNYEVTVFSPQSSRKPPLKNQPNADLGTTTPDEGNSTAIENEEDEQQVTIHLKGYSHLEKVSILPNENLAILVVTTEENDEQNVKEQLGVTRAPEFPSKKPKPSGTSGIPATTTQVFDVTSSIRGLKTSEATSGAEVSSRTTPSGIKGKFTSQSTVGVSTTEATIEQFTMKGDSLQSTSSSGVTNSTSDYYYDDEYDYKDYFYDYRRPPERAPNKPQYTQTFAPFPENDAVSFGDRIKQKNRKPNTTINIQGISVPTTPEASIIEKISNQILGYSTSRQPPNSIKRPQVTAHKPSKVNVSSNKHVATSTDNKSGIKTSALQTPIKDKENQEVTISELITYYRDPTIFQEMYDPSTINLHELSSSTTKRQSPAVPQFTVDVVPDRVHTTSSDDYRRTDGSTVHLSNKKRITTENPYPSPTADELFEISTRSRRPASTKPPGVKRPYGTMSYPESSGIITTADNSGNREPPSSSGIKTINNVLPQGIAEVLWSLTESTPQGFEQETPSFKDFTSTISEELSTVNPTDGQELLASPKLIVQSSLSIKDQQSTQVYPTTGIPVINNHDPPPIVFSNHRPSLNKRPVPVPQVHTNPFTTVNNHKNSYTSFGIPLRQKTTIAPLLEFSNHKPITSTSFLPPLPVETRKPSFFRPTGDANKNRFSPFKVHRVIPEMTNGENSSKESNDSVNSEEKSIKTEDLPFGSRTSSRPFDEKKEAQTPGNKVTATLRWNDASTNPVTVGFDVQPDYYGMDAETKEAVDDQFELNVPDAFEHSTSKNHDLEASSSSTFYSTDAAKLTTTEIPLTQSYRNTFHSTSESGKVPRVTEPTDTTTITESHARAETNKSPASNSSAEIESPQTFSVENTSPELSVHTTEKPTSRTESYQSSLEVRNGASVSKGNIDGFDEKDQSWTERSIKGSSYHDFSSPSTLPQSADLTETTNEDRDHDLQMQPNHRVKGGAIIEHKQPSKDEHAQQPEVSQNVSNAGNESKLYRAEENNKQAESSFIDRLIPYGGGHEQRLPHLPVRPHAVLPERKTTTPAPQVTSASDEKEIGDVCFVDGRFYKSGETIVKENPCEICRCFYGHPLCQVQQCPPPPGPACILEYLSGYCCPRVTCGVKLDGLRPPSDVNSIFSVPNDVRPPSITMDNQWRPVESPRPQAPKNATGNENQPLDGHGSLINDQANVPGSADSEETSETDYKVDISFEAANPSQENFKESFIPKKGEPEADNVIVTTPYSSVAVLDFQPKPVFDPNFIKKNEKKDPPAIHDNSSGVRKILNEAVTLPPSKMSVPPPAPAEVNPVLPSFYIRTPASRKPVNETASPPTLDFIIGQGIDNLPAELGGNLKVSGCNVYGKYYKINDKVPAISQPCSECICSSEGITCNTIC